MHSTGTLNMKCKNFKKEKKKDNLGLIKCLVLQEQHFKIPGWSNSLILDNCRSFIFYF